MFDSARSSALGAILVIGLATEGMAQTSSAVGLGCLKPHRRSPPVGSRWTADGNQWTASCQGRLDCDRVGQEHDCTEHGIGCAASDGATMVDVIANGVGEAVAALPGDQQVTALAGLVLLNELFKGPGDSAARTAAANQAAEEARAAQAAADAREAEAKARADQATQEYLQNNLKGLRAPLLEAKLETSAIPGELKLKLGDEATKGYGIPGLPGIYTGGPRTAADSGTDTGSTGELKLKRGDEATKGYGIPGLPGIYLNGSQQPVVGLRQAQDLALSAENLSGPEKELVEAAALNAALADPTLMASPEESVRTFTQADQQYERARELQARAAAALSEAQQHHEAALAAVEVAEAQFQAEKSANRDPAAVERRQQDLSQSVARASTDEFAWRIARQQFETATADVTVKRGTTLQALRAVSPAAPPSAPPSAVRTVPATPPSAPDFSYLYALQTRTLTPMRDGGHPLDAPGSPPVGLHGLVGGTTWTFGFRRPYVNCDQRCEDEIKKNLDRQLSLFCSSQSDPACFAKGLPFRPEMYDFAVSMGSSHAAIEDLATRVLFDGATFGEFSRQNKEIFASLTGRAFDTLDCHSNGALLCLAALRSGDTTAKEVRLFGPQMSPEAAKRWQEYSANTGTTIKIYINHGDPVAALSWKQPTPQTPVERATSAAWLLHPATGPAALADALFNTYWDSKTDVMGPILRNYGFKVTRWTCEDLPSIDCHSMRLYEERLRDEKLR